jgi:membrane fusion protein (multidrug efflux system)
VRTISIFITALFGLFFSSCSTEKTEAKKEQFPVTTPLVIDTNSHLDYVAEIKAVKNIEIRAKVSGFLDRVHIDEGAEVKAGQLLFSIDNREYIEELEKKRAQAKSVRSEVKNAELELQNTQNLVNKGVISKIELEFAKNKLAAAHAKVEEAISEEKKAKLMLSFTEIRAPFSGEIHRLPVKIGSLIDVGTLLTTLSQNDEVFAYFNVSENEYLDFMSGLTKENKEERLVKLVLANGKTHSGIGVIETMDGEVDQSTGNISFRARFKNTDRLLKHGASGKVRIAKKFNQVLVIPQKSTFEIQDRTFVYVVGKNGKVRIRQVGISNRIPHLFIISNGVSPNEKIIYEGVQSITEGTQIEEAYIPMKRILGELSKL